ncbi:MAG: ATP-binding protein [Acidobacteriota bacterium]
MLDNLKIALKRQRRLILIFFLTIFLPSIALSIFGIRSLRNERFGLLKQLENEQRRAADFLENQLQSRFEDLDLALQNVVQNPCFQEKNYAAIKDLLSRRFNDEPLIEFVFLDYPGEETLFPLFMLTQPFRETTVLSPINESQRERLKNAQKLEFSQNNFSRAAVLYEQIFSRSQNKEIQARMLNNIARCYKKSGNYEKSIQYYSRICEDYTRHTTSASLPLDLIAKFQIIDCYQSKGDQENFITKSLDLYRNLLQMEWNLNADQFNTYSSMIEKDISDFLSSDEKDLEDNNYHQEFKQLKELHQKTKKKWEISKNIEKSILPELRRRISISSIPPSNPLHYTRPINQNDYLVIATAIPRDQPSESQGLLGIKINNQYLIHQEIKRIMDEFPFSQEVSLSISNLSGENLIQIGDSSSSTAMVETYFDENFPPWRVNFFSAENGDFNVMNLRKSFYFWTILTILILLTFGAFLVVRTVSHEMEILRLKSDFVSSVSHEFKTPITAIKTLIERLQQGKIRSLDKRKKYYSIISKDVDKLGSLVRNILDYSKVDAQKKRYYFQKTDIGQQIREEIADFKKDKIYEKIKIKAQIETNIPSINIDREAFSLALSNLLENAVKFSPDQKAILVAAKQEGETIQVDIKDKGMGIDPSETDRIFDKFYQGKNTDQKSLGGTGLGLTLVKQVMEAHEGKVKVKSKMGEGSAFSLIFPIKLNERKKQTS